ncbi:MAG: lysophospholipid acyltransferase family protein [Chitinivibrionales bacterium]|nr:lysophospholipid acyltransferase family protein [Chitinivibrionales bacterium]
MQKATYYLEYCFLRILEALISCLPRGMALALGKLAGNALYFTGYYKSVALQNMRYVGLGSEREITRILKRLYGNMGRYAADFIRNGKRPPPFTVSNSDLLTGARKRNKGAIAILAHFGNWEIMANVFGPHLGDLNVLAKPMKNPFVEKWLLKKRLRAGVKPIYMDNAVRKMVSALKNNEIVAVLIDQFAGGQGTMAPFLGKEANTIRTVAGLLQRFDCSILPSYALLEKNGSYLIVIEETGDLGIRPEQEEQFINAYQKEHNDIISRWILAHPDHWFGWFHKRFKGKLNYL